VITRVADGRILYANKHLGRLLDLEAEQLVGQVSPDFYYDPQDRVMLLEGLEREGRVDSLEVRLKKTDGSMIWTLFSMVITEMGGERVVVGGIYDITERKWAEEQLQVSYRRLQQTQAKLVQSEKMAALGNLVAGITHEMNTPMGAMQSMQHTLVRAVEKLQRDMETQLPDIHRQNPALRAPLKIIDNAGKVINQGMERLSGIVERLQNFVRLDESEMKEADLHQGLENALLFIQRDLDQRIELVRQFGELLPVICYPSQLNQVFLHLLTNAMQAIDEQGRICIRTGLVEGRVWISIEDSGKGMSLEQLERVFDPGFTTKGGRIGAGLGLSICYQIIQDHRGEIQAESVPGEGTTFTMVLPVDLSKEPSPEEGGRSEA
jgi:two-component system NtrC family sensor kinase